MDNALTDWSIERYDPSMQREWDEFVRSSRNGTFLLTRPYMDYHSDRFSDCSLVARKKGRILALLPANISPVSPEHKLSLKCQDDVDGKYTLHSHQGLTYGGWITAAQHFDGAEMLALGRVWMVWCRDNRIACVNYKPVPWIFTRFPAQEDEYLLFRCGAHLVESNLSATIDLRDPKGFNTLQRRHLKKSLSLNPVIVETQDARPFWNMLNECLNERHGTSPVHTAAELELLRSRFPDNIRIFEVRVEETLMAGVCIYDTGTVAHAQYIATTPEGRRLNMLTPLFSHLITEVFSKYFDFGISNEGHGRYLNEGLLRQKCSYGASGVTFNRWTIDVAVALENLIPAGI